MGYVPTSGSTWEVSTTGSSYTAVAGVKDIGDWSVDHEKVDTTDKDSAGWKSHVAGDKSMSCSVSGNRDYTDPGQAILVDAAINGTMLYHRFRPAVGVIHEEWLATGTVSFKSSSQGNGGVVPFSSDITFSGAPTHQTQTA